MPELRQAEKVERHDHIVYLKDDGTGISSVDGKRGDKHRHLATRDDAGLWFLQPVNEGGHTHEMVAVKTEEAGAGEKPFNKINATLGLFKQSNKDDSKNRKNADESEEFYRGDQWSREDTPEDPSRSTLVINHSEGVVDVLSGYQRTSRTDFRVFPVEEGDQVIADILNILLKNISYTNSFPRHESKWWEDLLVPGRGAFRTWIDRDSNPLQPDVRIERFPERHCYLGPHELDDASDKEYYCKAKWYSLAKAVQLWPEKAKKLRSVFPQAGGKLGDTPDIPEHDRFVGTQYVDSTLDNAEQILIAGVVRDPDLVNLAKQEVRVIECWRKHYKKLHQIIHLGDEFIENAFGWNQAQIKQASTIEGIRVLPRKTHRWRVTSIAANIVLSDMFVQDDPESPDLIIGYAKRRRGHWWSLVHKLKDPQREIDKRSSQFIDAVNNMSGRVWFWDDNTFSTPDDQKRAQQDISQSGAWIKVATINNVPQQGGGLENFPSDIIQGIVIANESFQRLANIPPSQEALEKSGVSGVALVQKEKRGLLGNQHLFDTSAWTKQELGRRLIRLIAIAYDTPRIMRILGSEAIRVPEDAPTIAEIPIDELTKEARAAIEGFLNEADLSKYDIVVDESKWSPTMRNANFQDWVAIAQHMPVPPQMLLGLSPMPAKQKREYNQMFQKQVEGEQAKEQGKQQTEIQKTLIAAQSKGKAGAQA